MAKASERIDVYLEIGKVRAFAGALGWPGWCRGGRDEAAALQALFESGPRYARVVRSARLGFRPPGEISALRVVERLEGNSTTDFGAPGLAPSADARPVEDGELRRLQALLQACWRAFDSALEAAGGKELRKGPRGGGRDQAGIARHVLEADSSYLMQLGWKLKPGEGGDPVERLAQVRKEIRDGLAAAARGELPARGPRGGLRWTPRYFVRRSAWHVLDHAWEVEDRVL